MIAEALICDAVRTPIGRFGGSLASIRYDDLVALVLKALAQRNGGVDWEVVDDVIHGCANQADKDNRNVARMASLLAGFPIAISGTTVNCLCGFELDAVAIAARVIRSDEADLAISGEVESMSGTPFVLPKAEAAFSRNADIYDTTIGWRFVNSAMKPVHSIDSMPETAENVSREFMISRQDQDDFAARGQAKATAAQSSGRLGREVVGVSISQRKGEAIVVDQDEHLRATSAEALAKREPVVRADGTVTAGNASGINEGVAVLIVASEAAARRYGLTPWARVVGAASAGVRQAIMGIGPLDATRKRLAKTGLKVALLDLVELNGAFASHARAVLRELGIVDDARVWIQTAVRSRLDIRRACRALASR